MLSEVRVLSKFKLASLPILARFLKMTKVRGVKLQIAIYKITENSTSNVVNKQKVEVWGLKMVWSKMSLYFLCERKVSDCQG